MSSAASLQNLATLDPGLQPAIQDAVRAAHRLAGTALSEWQRLPLKQRLQVIRQIRHQLAEQGESIAESVAYPGRVSVAETLAAEIIPLADACWFLEREATKILAPQSFGRRGRPTWLAGVTLRKQWEPLGIVLVIGAANYPLLLPGVQALQAIAAGNAVLLKPGQWGRQPAASLIKLFESAGVPAGLVGLLPEAHEAVDASLACGVAKVFLTGSAQTGRAILEKLTPKLVPAALELSGCDAVVVLPSANLPLVAKALAFGLSFNSSGTCIAPRRVFVASVQRAELQSLLVEELQRRRPPPAATIAGQPASWIAQAIAQGAEVVYGAQRPSGQPGLIPVPRFDGPVVLAHATPNMTLFRQDVFAPIIGLFDYESSEQAIALSRDCPYALGASVFGEHRAASAMAQSIDAGCVVINDLIVPTADPRVAFGGRHQSGYGLTRGPEGLREMVQLKAILERRSRWLPHFNVPTDHDQDILAGYLGYQHATRFSKRVANLFRLVRAAMAQSRNSGRRSNSLPSGNDR